MESPLTLLEKIMTIGNRLRFDVMRSLAYTSINNSWVAVGSSLTHPASQILIQNLTDATLVFSFDGVNNHFALPTSGFFLDDITTNKVSPAGGLYLPVGTTLYVQEVGTPGSGSVYFSVTYIAEN